MTIATVGSRYQVVIPRRERERIGLKPNAKVHIEAHDRYVILYPETASGLRGLGRELTDGRDATDYVKQLRSEWTDRS